MPSTKPDLFFDEDGVCNACKFYSDRSAIDWTKRKFELENILKNYRDSKGENWDCIVPVSGGKDSTFQVLSVLKLGMNPLCVTSTTCDLSVIGERTFRILKA
jgi:tRNA(Ile)-lysidine synthase TilS/MesJ